MPPLVPVRGTACGAAHLEAAHSRFSLDRVTHARSKACSERVGLFVRSATGHVDVNPRVIRKRRGVETLRVLGRFIGKAVFERHLIDIPLSRALCLRILGKSPGLDDLSVSGAAVPERQLALCAMCVWVCVPVCCSRCPSEPPWRAQLTVVPRRRS